MNFRFQPIGLLLLAGGAGCAFSSARAGAIPDSYGEERYAALWEHSPFTLATVQPVAQPGFAQNLTVVGFAQIDGKDMVILLNRVTQERATLGTEPNADGIALVSVEADSDPLKTKVTLRKGTEVATISFDKATLAMAQSQPLVPPPNPPPVNGAAGTPAAANSVTTPVMRVRRPMPIPGINPSAVSPATTAAPAQ
jgi:hypothetical protein